MYVCVCVPSTGLSGCMSISGGLLFSSSSGEAVTRRVRTLSNRFMKLVRFLALSSTLDKLWENKINL